MIQSHNGNRLIRLILCNIVFSLLFFNNGCFVTAPTSSPLQLQFAAVNTGQGLAQIVARDSHAVVFDMGTDSGFAEWTLQYQALSNPRIEAIIISHSHVDHYAGLSQLPPDIFFSGIIITSPYEDTALIRRSAGAWQDRIVFRLLKQSDTLMIIPGATLTCLWPPDSLQSTRSQPIADSLKNRYSMVWKINYQTTSFLITGDIDSTATRQLSAAYGFELHTTVIIVPHHGSQSAYDPVFYGYCTPQYAVISCARYNSYGHPSEKIIDLLFGLNIDEMRTYSAGSVRFESNGEYLRQN